MSLKQFINQSRKLNYRVIRQTNPKPINAIRVYSHGTDECWVASISKAGVTIQLPISNHELLLVNKFVNSTVFHV